MTIEKLMRGEPGVRECSTPYPKEKVYIEVDENGVKTLVSFGDKIIRKYPDGHLTRLCTNPTHTTSRHIISFCGKHKAEFNALELENP